MHALKTRFHIPHLSIAQRWIAVLSCAMLVAIGVFAYSVFFFIGAFKADVPSQAQNIKTESISREKLSQTVNTFEARQQAFERLRSIRAATASTTQE